MKAIDKSILLSNPFNSVNSKDIKTLIEELKLLSFKERDFLLFQIFYNGLDRETYEKLKIIIHSYPFMFRNFNRTADEALEARQIKLEELHNRNKSCYEIMEKYKSLLEKMSYLAKELNLNNSLELSILFSYLLWKGYLSKTKKHKYQSENRKMIAGLLFTDIMDGIGVCLNYSEMLKDFLNNCGYQSTIISNHFDSNSRYDFLVKIEGVEVNSLASKEGIFKRKKADHTFNLIEENSKLYIYDPTNLLLYNVINSSYSNLVNGKGRNKLFSYQSYSFCLSEKDKYLINRLFTEDEFPSPYTKEEFICFSEVSLEIIKNSTFLLEDFYTEARQDIIGISEDIDKAIKKQKNKN